MLSPVGPGLTPVPAPLATVVNSVTTFADFDLFGVTLDTVADYSGAGLADRTRSDASVGLHGLQKSQVGEGLISGEQYYADLVLKPDGRSFILVQLAGPGNNAYAILDLTLNTVGDSSGIDSATVTDLSNGWKFVRIIFTAAATGLYSCNMFHATSGSNYSMAGDITKGLILDRFVLSYTP